jgi:hypothetical protein
MADDGTPSMVEDDTSPPVEETNTGPAGGGKEHQLIFLCLGIVASLILDASY